MSSSPIDAGLARLAPPRFAVKQLLPRTLLGRSVLIIVMPLILVQLVATWVFYDRHWDTVSRRLANSVAGEIALVIDALELMDDESEVERLFTSLSGTTEIDFELRPHARLATTDDDDSAIATSMRELVRRPFAIGPGVDPKDVLIRVQLDDAVLEAATPRKRLTTYTTNLVLIWMVGSSIVFFFVATLFRSHRPRRLRLAGAAQRAEALRHQPRRQRAPAREACVAERRGAARPCRRAGRRRRARHPGRSA